MILQKYTAVANHYVDPSSVHNTNNYNNKNTMYTYNYNYRTHISVSSFREGMILIFFSEYKYNSVTIVQPFEYIKSYCT